MNTEGYALRRSGLFWRQWDGEIVVYSDLSGDTHHLDALAAEVFEALIEAPSDFDGLVKRISASLSLEPATELRDALAGVLQGFEAFGLLEPKLA